MELSHIDTCLPCYLQDHHNRPGELLLQASVDGNTTYGDVKDELLQELNGLMIDSESFDYDEARKAICEAFLPVPSLAAKFDSSLDVLTDEEAEMGELCYAWFLLTWDEEGDSDVA